MRRSHGDIESIHAGARTSTPALGSRLVHVGEARRQPGESTGPKTPGSARDRFRGSLLGLACGDAVATTLEFRARGTFSPVRGMVGGGPFDLAPGEWTDDTSMALCLAESLTECGGFDPGDQIERYCRWWREGHWSSNGSCFDIGNTVRSALEHFLETGESFAGSTDPRSAGNGSIMRLAPVALFFHPDTAAVLHYSAQSSRTTHGCGECVDACRVLGGLLDAALAGADKAAILAAGRRLAEADPLAPGVAAVARGSYLEKPRDAISGDGYVVRSLEAALWCFARTETFEQAVLEAANLGDDADTTAAVCGQLAGAHYGAQAIPPAWLDLLARRDEIEAMADALSGMPRSPGAGKRDTSPTSR
jgi:ADP-ribosyl-[dinitrogen reductase] hydrolase